MLFLERRRGLPKSWLGGVPRERKMVQIVMGQKAKAHTLAALPQARDRGMPG